MLSKITLREQLCAKRKAISAQEIHSAASLAAAALSHDAQFLASKHIACYLAYAGEIETQPIIDLIWRLGKICYLPLLHPDREQGLYFVAYHPGDTLIVNRFGIAEPSASLAQGFPVDALDLVVLPLVGFDREGHRLGMGGGYYDRTFATRVQGAKPRLLGYAYACQGTASLPHDPWDIPLDYALTEQGITTFV